MANFMTKAHTDEQRKKFRERTYGDKFTSKETSSTYDPRGKSHKPYNYVTNVKGNRAKFNTDTHTFREFEKNRLASLDSIRPFGDTPKVETPNPVHTPKTWDTSTNKSTTNGNTTEPSGYPSNLEGRETPQTFIPNLAGKDWDEPVPE